VNLSRSWAGKLNAASKQIMGEGRGGKKKRGGQMQTERKEREMHRLRKRKKCPG